MKRKDIIDKLNDDMSDKMHAANGYNITPVEIIKDKIVGFNDVVQRPAVGFHLDEDEIEDENLNNNRERMITFTVYGYADVALGENSTIHLLAEDVENFLYSNHWTYTNSTLLGNAKFFTTYLFPDRSAFYIEVKVQYTQT